MKTDPRVDAYIAQAPPFAQPILQEARSRVGKTCPSAEETIKWNVPFFLLGEKILASMAAFKKHVKVGVWTGMMPKFVDVSEVEELPPNKDFAQQLLTAAKAIDGAMTSKSAEAAPVKSAPKAPAPKARAKASAREAAIKLPSVKKAPAPKAPAPKARAPKAPAPKARAPKAAAPKARAPKAAAPKARAKAFAKEAAIKLPSVKKPSAPKAPAPKVRS